jgi:hypothetical protein
MTDVLELNKIKPPENPHQESSKDALDQKEEAFLEAIYLLEKEVQKEKIEELREIKSSAGLAGGALLGASVFGFPGALGGGIAGYFLANWANKQKV